MLRDLCREHGLGRLHQPAFRRRLVAALRDAGDLPAERVARLGRDRLNLLYRHFREPTPTAPKPWPHFTALELRLVREACLQFPFPVRFVRPFKGLLVELFEREWPALGQKLARLSGQ